MKQLFVKLRNNFWARILYLNAKIAYLKKKIICFFKGERVEITEQGKKFFLYCCKIMKNRNYNFSDYQEKMFYELLTQMAEENNTTTSVIACAVCLRFISEGVLD